MAEACALIQSLEKAVQKVFLNEEKIKPALSEEARYESDIWYLDIGASNHITGSKTKFTNLDTTVSGKVNFGDGSTVDIKG